MDGDAVATRATVRGGRGRLKCLQGRPRTRQAQGHTRGPRGPTLGAPGVPRHRPSHTCAQAAAIGAGEPGHSVRTGGPCAPDGQNSRLHGWAGPPAPSSAKARGWAPPTAQSRGPRAPRVVFQHGQPQHSRCIVAHHCGPNAPALGKFQVFTAFVSGTREKEHQTLCYTT